MGLAAGTATRTQPALPPDEEEEWGGGGLDEWPTATALALLGSVTKWQSH